MVEAPRVALTDVWNDMDLEAKVFAGISPAPGYTQRSLTAIGNLYFCQDADADTPDAAVRIR